MPETSLNGVIAYPRPVSISTVTTSMTASGDKAAFVFQIAKTGTVTKIGFLTGTVTTGDTVDVRLETVNTTTGAPTGTLWATNTNGSQAIDAADDNTWFTVTLTAGASVTKGDIVAVVIVNGGTPGNMEIVHGGGGLFDEAFPYITDFAAAVWTSDNESPNCALEYSDGSYAYSPGVYPFSAINISVAYNNTSDPDHRGLKFQLPVPVRVVGGWFESDLEAAANLKLYDSDGTSVLESISVPSGPRSTTGHGVHIVFFTSAHSLSKDTYYRLVLEPSTTTSIDLDEISVPTAAVLDGWDGGQNFHYTQKKDAGWTDTTTKRPMMGLLIDALDDGTSGSVEFLVLLKTLASFFGLMTLGETLYKLIQRLEW